MKKRHTHCQEVKAQGPGRRFDLRLLYILATCQKAAPINREGLLFSSSFQEVPSQDHPEEFLLVNSRSCQVDSEDLKPTCGQPDAQLYLQCHTEPSNEDNNRVSTPLHMI